MIMQFVYYEPPHCVVLSNQNARCLSSFLSLVCIGWQLSNVQIKSGVIIDSYQPIQTFYNSKNKYIIYIIQLTSGQKQYIERGIVRSRKENQLFNFQSVLKMFVPLRPLTRFDLSLCLN